MDLVKMERFSVIWRVEILARPFPCKQIYRISCTPELLFIKVSKIRFLDEGSVAFFYLKLPEVKNFSLKQVTQNKNVQRKWLSRRATDEQFVAKTNAYKSVWIGHGHLHMRARHLIQRTFFLWSSARQLSEASENQGQKHLSLCLYVKPMYVEVAL